MTLHDEMYKSKAKIHSENDFLEALIYPQAGSLERFFNLRVEYIVAIVWSASIADIKIQRAAVVKTLNNNKTFSECLKSRALLCLFFITLSTWSKEIISAVRTDINRPFLNARRSP